MKASKQVRNQTLHECIRRIRLNFFPLIFIFNFEFSFSPQWILSCHSFLVSRVVLSFKIVECFIITNTVMYYTYSTDVSDAIAATVIAVAATVALVVIIVATDLSYGSIFSDNYLMSQPACQKTSIR